MSAQAIGLILRLADSRISRFLGLHYCASSHQGVRAILRIGTSQPNELHPREARLEPKIAMTKTSNCATWGAFPKRFLLMILYAQIERGNGQVVPIGSTTELSGSDW